MTNIIDLDYERDKRAALVAAYTAGQEIASIDINIVEQWRQASEQRHSRRKDMQEHNHQQERKD